MQHFNQKNLTRKPAFVLRHIQRATILMMLGTLFENFLSFVKSLLIAAYYGTSAQLDAYFLSLAPLRLISGVLVGSVQAALIPRYLELKQKKGGNYAFSVFGTFLLCIMLFITVIIIIFWGGSSILASYLGKGFDEWQVNFTASLLRISTILLALIILNDVGLCLFHAHRRFTFSAFVPVLGGGCSLAYIVYFRDQGVPSLMYGLIFGMFIQSSVVLYTAQRFFPTRLKFLSPLHPEIYTTFKLMIPLLVGASFGHVNVVVDQMMASTLPPGSIAALHYATKLHNIFTQLFVMIISKVMLPFLAQHVAENDIEAMKRTFFLTAKRTLYILLPISVLIIVFAPLLVQVIFQRGAFTAYSTSSTAGAWIAYTLGLPIQAIGILTARVYNALQDNKTLMYVAGGGIGLNILFNWIFMRIWGHIGIALSTSVLYCVATGILLYILYKKIGAFWKE